MASTHSQQALPEISHHFRFIPTNPYKEDFHGPYNMLLWALFPSSRPHAHNTHFGVVPIVLQDPVEVDEFGFAIKRMPFLEVQDARGGAVFVVGLRDQGELDVGGEGEREAADEEVRGRVREVIGMSNACMVWEI